MHGEEQECEVGKDNKLYATEESTAEGRTKIFSQNP